MITFKYYTFKDKYGVKRKLYYCCSEIEFTTQLSEIFFKECYKKGKIKKDMVVVDIGANVGSVFHYLKDYVKEYYAIEPEPNIFKCLVENTKDYPQVHRFNYGIFAYDGELPFYSKNDEDPPQSIVDQGDYSEIIKCKSFGSFLKETGLKHIDLLKIDIEGSEYLVFGSDSFIENADKIDFIIGEAHYNQNYQVDPRLLYPVLKESGFKVKFLPFKNLIRNFYINNLITKKNKTYTFTEASTFIAERIKK